MAKRQTRRSISVKGLTYKRVKAHVATLPEPPPGERPNSISGFVEQLIEKALGPVTPEERQKFGEDEEATVEAEETEQEPEPPPEPEAPEKPSEPPPAPESTEASVDQTAIPRTEELPPFTKYERKPVKKRPMHMQPEPIEREESEEDDPDAIPPAIRYF